MTKQFSIAHFSSNVVKKLMILVIVPSDEQFQLLYKLLFSRGFYFREFREPDPRENFHFNSCLIYSNDNIRKIAKLTTRELPQKSKNAKITVRENNGLYSTCFFQFSIYGCMFY